MIVIYRNGERTVLAGWRAWAVIVPVALVVAWIAVAVFSLLLGLALTLATIVLFALPVALVIAIIARLFPGRRYS